jgi:hypothetical protein
MIRAAMAVILATALLATSLPALDVARRDHSATAVRAELDRLATAMRDLAARDETVPPGAPGARRVVSLRVPGRSWTEAGVDYVAVAESSPAEAASNRSEPTVTWQVVDGAAQTRRLAGLSVDTDPPAGSADGPLVLRESGIHRLELTLVRRAGAPTVVVRRLR